MPKNVRQWVWIFFIVACVNTQAEEHVKPNLEDYGALPSISLVCVSPDGDKIGFRKVDANNNLMIVVYSRKEHKVVNTFYGLGKSKPHNLYFVDNNQLIFITSEYKRVEGYMGKLESSIAFLIDIEKNAVRPLLIPGEEEIYRGQEGLGKVVGVSPDKNYVYMTAYVGTDYVDPKYAVVRVNIKKKVYIRYVAGGDFSLRDFFLDNQGNVVAREGYNQKSKKYSISVSRNGSWVDIFSETVDFPSKKLVGLTPDYKYLMFVETDEKTNRDGYFKLNLTSGEITATEFGRTDADIVDAIVDPNRIVHGIVYDGFSPQYKFFDAEVDKRFQNHLAQFPDQSVSLVGWTDDWKSFVLNLNGSDYADTYFLAEEGKSPQYLTTGRPKFTAADINPIGKVTFKARDGLKIPTLITIPKENIQNIKNLPAVLLPHGGPEAHDELGFDWLAQAFASQGYLVIQPQFRGSSGFGAEHARAGRGEWGKKMQDDLTDAVKYFSEKGFINSKQVCIVGASYGGYAALAGGAYTPELYKCVVSINGIGDLNDFLSVKRFRTGGDNDLTRYLEMQFGNGDLDSKKMKEVSPRNAAKNFQVPVLIIYSDEDSRVPPDQSKDMQSALKEAKKNVELVVLQGDDHFLREGKTRTEAITAAVKFVNQNIRK